jgi:hypothetical protein
MGQAGGQTQGKWQENETRWKMTCKRGGVWWVKFQHPGRMIYRSSGQTSRTKARQIEARLRSELALGHYGILKREPIPTLADFIQERIEPKVASIEDDHGEQRFRWMRGALKPLTANLGQLSLNQITSENVLEYANVRLKAGLSIAAINRELRTLRRILRLAAEWNITDQVHKVAMAGNAAFRERVVSDDELARYLRFASLLLGDVVVIFK